MSKRDIIKTSFIKGACWKKSLKEYILKEIIIGGVGVKERQAASSETKRALGQKWQLAKGGDQLVLMPL